MADDGASEVFSAAAREKRGAPPTRAEATKAAAEQQKAAAAEKRARDKAAGAEIAKREADKKKAEDNTEKAKLARESAEYERKYNEYITRPVFGSVMRNVVPMPSKPKPQEAKCCYDGARAALGGAGGAERAKTVLALFVCPWIQDWYASINNRGYFDSMEPLKNKDLKNMAAHLLHPKFADLTDPLANEIDIEYPWLTRTNTLTRLLGTLVAVANRSDFYTKNPEKLNEQPCPTEPYAGSEEPR